MERVTVIIVNHNAGAHLQRATRQVLGQTLPPDGLIVVDNASSDGSLAGIEPYRSRLSLIRLTENVGYARATNIALEACGRDDLIALLNPDAFPEPGWLQALVSAARNQPEFASFASRMLKAGAGNELDGAGDEYHVSGVAWRRFHGCRADSCAHGSEEVFSACAAAALYRRTALREVGGFDERFFCYFEDVDLGYRLRLAGHRCLYVPEAVVHHVGSATTGGPRSSFTVYHGHRNMIWCFVKNAPAALLWLYLPCHLLANIAGVVQHAWGGRGRAVTRAKWDAIRGLAPVLRARRGVQAARRVGAWRIRAAMAHGLARHRSRARGAPSPPPLSWNLAAQEHPRGSAKE